MGAKILNGTELSKAVKQELGEEVREMVQRGVQPGLAVIIVGDDPASRVYVNNKKKACQEIGIASFEYALDANIKEKELIDLINVLNKDAKVNGILVQLPLPRHINEENVLYAIDPGKDADCFHPSNAGRLMIGNPMFMPCTPAGIIELINLTGIDIQGKECVVVGRSNIVGKPMSMLLLAKNGTVTVCHSKTRDLPEICRRADVLVAAIGKPEFIKGSFIKPGAVVIDVGMNRLENKKLVGDVEYASACEVASAITPVPGGVGPMTIAMLMRNTVKAARLQNGI
ncbi:methylenetetrahydrofolate dehydrogenase (NADP+)/methenyltetrahydrofolate cyclohydrolase [Anaerobacterium chartisolvens]|uniref:Bifunctional protein FolD n=1 Tax=Anaerobacterium chartisolvens TaxID=1297424 RepID=A0A369B9C2_9FIRM|nr:bifunctional methylenetetrahydrofolate dehydrogenase/methenyltetrahydrofolate cyclohydrolase FolD [Anaerobacterium chartisolvens]RCX17127.1 methylenetetrahydrofolate dehydrogenase (NADP+)/methenyltetrahydrofolate cyclohydrolase [Anaerobacterium chartisolvens]